MQGSAGTGAEISGFIKGDKIDLVDVASSAGGTAIWNSGTGLLTVTEGATVVTLQLDPSHDYAGDTFTPGFDGAAGTEITVVTCFCAGTAIATPTGEVAVEALRIGDAVLLADGRAMPVRWIGRQTVSQQFADPLRVLPVRIRAGALGEGLPRRDLRVSPGHALLLDGVLVQAGALEGMRGIARAAMPEVFAYWHVELDQHALLLAEGVAAESWLESAEAIPFDNRADRPARAPAAELPYPRVKAERQVPAALRARLRRPAAA